MEDAIAQPDWRLFECPECGCVETIDYAERKNPVCEHCGETLELIDEE